MQTSKNVRSQLFEIFRDCGLGKNIFEIAKFNSKDEISIFRDAKCIFKKPRAILQKFWFETSKNISSLRDNFEYTKTEEDQADLIISPEKVIKLTFPIEHKFKKSECYKDHEKSERKLNIIINKPRVGILREQGINGQNEMAAAFIQAGFEAGDVHMNDLIDGSTKLNNFEGIAVGGGFSYGDVLGAGKGWASTIQYNQKLCSDFENFFDNPKKFVLGVCNGCQFVSELSNKFSSSRLWPNFKINLSSRFESRQSLVEILQSNSIFLKPMAGSILPVVVSHGYGRVDIDLSNKDRSVDPAIRYVDFNGKFTEKYPDNPNGSVGGLTAFSSFDGRITIMMPHPERCFKLVQMSWYPKSWNNFGSYSPWAQLFKNAYNWVNDS